MTLPAYPNYKPSGVPWLGDVPGHWDFVRLKDVASIINGYPFDSKFFAVDGQYPLIRIRDLNATEADTRYNGEFIESAAIGNDDILIGMDGDFNVGRWLGDERALLNQRMCCVRTNSNDLRTILHHALPIPLKTINDLTYATTVKHLSSFDVEKIRFALPPEKEQTAIASFLDRETAKIDALIAEQEALLALLAEKRQATISHAVTRGLDAKVAMKDSGIAWIGKTPGHWVVMPIRLAAKLESGHTPSRNHPEYWEDCNTPWFTLADIWQVREGGAEYIHKTSEQISELGLQNSSARLLPKGTVMLSRTASVGFSAIMGTDMATSQDFANWICGSKLLPEFLLYAFRSMGGEFKRLMMGSTHNTIYMPDIQSLRFSLPPLNEQKEIVENIRNSLRGFDSLQNEAVRGIELLKERRSALVAAAVTGKVDVRNVA